MKSNQNTTKNHWLRLAPIALAIGLAACDNNGDGSSNISSDSNLAATRDMPTGTTTGVLTDAQVAGVSYTTTSGKSGVTDANGSFNFDHGDTVEFKLGALTLGNIQATPIVTPLALADGNENKIQNLIILLQSLDSDGDPSNGISITADAAAAVNTSLDLQSNPATFAGSTELQAILEAAGIDGNAKTAEEASAHFLAHSTAILGTNIWVRYNDQIANVIRIAADGSGEYLQGQASPDDSCNINRVCAGRTLYKAGVEYGIASALGFNARGFNLVGKATVDTNLRAGLSDPDPERRVRTDGYAMISSDIVTVQREREKPSVFGELFHIASPIELSDENEVILKEVKETRYSKMDHVSSDIVGAWAYDKDAINTPTLMFFANNKFMRIDPTGTAQRKDQVHCAEPGIEFASYAYNKSANKLNISRFTYNTDGCIGFSAGDSSLSHRFTISADGDTAELEKQGDEPVTLYRISS